MKTTTTVITCDVCRHEIGNHGVPAYEVTILQQIVDPRTSPIKKDLCAACKSGLLVLLDVARTSDLGRIGINSAQNGG